MEINKARRDGLSLLFLGMSIVALMLAYLLGHPSDAAMQDFRVVYSPAKCLLRHCDPYSPSQVLWLYQQEVPARSMEYESDRQIVTRSIYPPSAFVVTLPFAALPWEWARRAWPLMTVAGLLTSSFLLWDLAAVYGPILAGILAAWILANSEILVVLGNPSGIVLALTIAAVWCFLRGRFVPAGIVCMALALAVKPQIPGFIWLYFLLARNRSYRKNALWTLLVLAVLGLPVLLWVWSLSPNWIGEWSANLHFFTARGAQADPGPASSASHGAGAMISLQTVFSLIQDSPWFYDLAAWATCAPFLLLWMWATLKSQSTEKQSLLALAVIAPLSLLPSYHHIYDAKLLLLLIPACAILWKDRKATGWSALALTSIALLITGDLPATFLLRLVDGWRLPANNSSAMVKLAVERFPVPLILLTVAGFYLRIYAREARRIAPSEHQ
jgi:hypothetical protein